MISSPSEYQLKMPYFDNSDYKIVFQGNLLAYDILDGQFSSPNLG